MSLNTILATTPLTTTNFHLKATGTTIGNSLIWDNGTNVGIGNTNTSYTLDVSGTGRFTGQLIANSTSFPLDVYGTTNNYGLRINNVQAATLFLYSSNANAASRNWGLFTNSEVYGDFDIRQSNAINGDLTNGANSTSRFYINNNGNVSIGTSTDLNYKLNIYSPDLNNTAGTCTMKNGSNNGGGYFVLFQNYLGGTAGVIQQLTSTTILYNSSSDYRLKEDILPMQNAIDRILKIKPVTYKWKNTEDEYGEGFIAHELQEIVPLAVGGEKDDMNKDGTIKPQGIDYGKLTPLLVAAIQEQQAQIQNLQEQINILAK